MWVGGQVNVSLCALVRYVYVREGGEEDGWRDDGWRDREGECRRMRGRM